MTHPTPPSWARRALFGALALALPLPLAAQDTHPETMSARQKAAIELDRITPADVAHWGVHPEEMAWIDDLDVPGVHITYLLAEPRGEPFVFRLKFPDGYAVASHSHARRRLVTVLEGTYEIGFGDVANRDKTVAWPAGSYFVIPAGVHHFAWTRGPTVVQVVGTGDMEFDWLTNE